MAKALVVTRRERLLPLVLQALAGGELVVLTAPDPAAAASQLARTPVDLLLLDFASLPSGAQSRSRTLAADRNGAQLAALVTAEDTAALRRATALPLDALLLDPLDLDAGATTIARLLARRVAAAREADPLDGLSSFLKGLAHEILNPLTPITAFLQILKRDPALTPELKDRYEKMLEGSRRIEKTVRDLECFARVRKPQRALFDLVPFLREQEERWRQLEPALITTLDAPAEAPLVLGDREQLAIALRHLAGFASGADRAAPVALALRPAPRHVELSILGDAPVKLPPRPVDALLPYHDMQGSGRPGTLELASAWGILRSHRATLEVEPRPSGGVRFAVSFPNAPLAHDAAGEE